MADRKNDFFFEIFLCGLKERGEHRGWAGTVFSFGERISTIELICLFNYHIMNHMIELDRIRELYVFVI